MKKLDEDNETFRHDTVSHEFRTAAEQARMTKTMTQPQLTTTMREKRAIINEYESGRPLRTTHFSLRQTWRSDRCRGLGRLEEKTSGYLLSACARDIWFECCCFFLFYSHLMNGSETVIVDLFSRRLPRGLRSRATAVNLKNSFFFQTRPREPIPSQRRTPFCMGGACDCQRSFSWCEALLPFGELSGQHRMWSEPEYSDSVLDITDKWRLNWTLLMQPMLWKDSPVL